MESPRKQTTCKQDLESQTDIFTFIIQIHFSKNPWFVKYIGWKFKHIYSFLFKYYKSILNKEIKPHVCGCEYGYMHFLFIIS